MAMFDEDPEEKKKRQFNTLLGQGVETTGSMRSTDVFDEQGNPVYNDPASLQPTRREGTGFLGSDRGAGAQAVFQQGLAGAGYDPKQVRGVIEPFQKQQKEQAAAANKMREASIKQGNVLRKERGAALKPFNEAKTQYNTTMNALQQDSGAGTLAAIFSFMKTLDPRSVVREGEFQMGTQTGGVVDSLVGMVNRAKGEGMGPEAREGISRAIQAIMEGRVADAEAIAASFDQIARDQNVPVNQIRSGEFNPELQGVPESFLQYEYRIDPKTGKQQRKLKRG